MNTSIRIMTNTVSWYARLRYRLVLVDSPFIGSDITQMVSSQIMLLVKLQTMSVRISS